MSKRHDCAFIATLLPLCCVPFFAATLSFQPDFTFKSSNLAGWKTIGAVDWSAHNGEIVGSAKQGSAGGWLVGEHQYQDVGLHASFRCSDNCQLGILLRGKTTATGMEGTYVSLTEGDMASYQVDLDAQGNLLKREKLVRAGGVERIAPPPRPAEPGQRNPGQSGRGVGGRPQSEVTLPVSRPSTALRPNDWNEVEIFLDANVVRVFLNNGSEVAGRIADEDMKGFGSVAFFVSGPGQVTFKDLEFKDLAKKITPTGMVSPHFRVQRINDMFYSWGAAAGDFNHDRILDVVAGPYIYWGPDFTKYQEIYPAVALNPSKDFPAINCEYAFDYNKDGWTDILTGPPNATLYINPKGESRRWDKYVVVPNIQSEITVTADIDGDGVSALVYESEGYVRYAKPDPADPTKPWIVHTISERGYTTAHGIGAGDINGDGLMDIVNPFGWWEHPPTDSKQELWTYHPVAFARYGRGTVGGASMGVYDVNGDGMNDVVTSLNAHGFGFAWYEQKRDTAGNISFVEHIFSDDYSTKNAGGVTFSQPHGNAFADVDGDGVPDFIVGKRYGTHLDSYHDPDPYGAPVLYWYRTVRNKSAPGGAEFIPELIHNRSGAGSDVLAVDLNKDGAVDIVTSTDRGTFIFWGMPRENKQRTSSASEHLRKP
jgi:hypothetical protein